MKGTEAVNRRTWQSIGVGVCLVVGSIDTQTAASTVVLNPSVTYQTFSGWETAVLSTLNDYKRVLPAFDALLDEMVNDLGVTRLQIAISSGTEHPPGPGEQFVSGELPEQAWLRQFAYNPINDNRNSKVADPKGFDFAVLDWQMENVVLPFKRRVDAHGDMLYSYLSYADKGEAKYKQLENPAEYAELMVVIFDHLKTKYGFVPDGINVLNEPDSTQWTGDDMGRATAKTGAVLAAAGYHPDFMVASVVDRGKAVSFFEDVIAVRGAKQYVKELSYHCYRDSGENSLKRIGEASVKYGVRTVMNECWSEGNTYKTLHDDLKVGRNSVWQQGVFNGANTYYHVERTADGGMRPVFNEKTKIMRQYYKYVRPGAQRIEATGTDSTFDPLAFINVDGGYVTVIKAEAGGPCVVEGLPPGTYSISYTTPAEFDVHLPDVTLAAGEGLTASIPQPGVLTVYRKAVATAQAVQ